MGVYGKRRGFQVHQRCPLTCRKWLFDPPSNAFTLSRTEMVCGERITLSRPHLCRLPPRPFRAGRGKKSTVLSAPAHYSNNAGTCRLQKCSLSS